MHENKRYLSKLTVLNATSENNLNRTMNFINDKSEEKLAVHFISKDGINIAIKVSLAVQLHQKS